jgi:hypothetical protein
MRQTIVIFDTMSIYTVFNGPLLIPLIYNGTEAEKRRTALLFEQDAVHTDPEKLDDGSRKETATTKKIRFQPAKAAAYSPCPVARRNVSRVRPRNH